MKRHFTLYACIFFIICVFNGPTHAQSEANLNRVGLTRLMQSFNAISIYDEVEERIEGSEYLLDGWNKGNLYGKLDADSMRIVGNYDIDEKSVILNVDGRLGKLNANYICYFMLENSKLASYIKLVNPGCYFDWGSKSDELIQLLYEGSYSLGIQYFVDILPPSYNPALNTGNKNVEIVQKSKYCVMHNERLLTLPTKRKKLISFFEEQFDLNVKNILSRFPKSDKDFIVFFQKLNAEMN